MQAPSQQVSGLVVVKVPKDTALTGSGFSFAVPQEIMNMVSTIDQVDVTLSNGRGLPEWLSFDSSSMVFSAQAVPDGGLPLQVRVTIGGQSITLVVSELEDQLASSI